MRSLSVYLNHWHVGTIHEGEDLWSFEYDAAWQVSAEGFDLSPALPRSTLLHRDGGSVRPVQWYFDNLLPEEKLREAVSREAGIQGDDAFALLQYLGAESAGSLTLLPLGESPNATGSLQPLPDAELSTRIRNMPQESLSHGAPKRMSAAGAQNKLLVVYRDQRLFEPVGSEPSTHILKPNHPSADYPASVINEYLVMRLAESLGLLIPKVSRRYVPEPVYLIERFDRTVDAQGVTRRSHIIDACQLLNKSRIAKYTAATLESLREVIERCTNKAQSRLVIFEWLAFNVLVGNNDCHLKNLSFRVSPEGIAVSPLYDLLCTMAYHTRALANERADWPRSCLAIPLPGCESYAGFTGQSLIEAGTLLGIPINIARRQVLRMARLLPVALDELIERMETENASIKLESRHYLAGDLRLANAIRHIILPDMLGRLALSS
jgi:serine/threonine-protein kinase HipA